jgi:hypothetical protein
MVGRNVRQYLYTDLAGKPRVRKLRKDPKSFRMESWVSGEHDFWAKGIRPAREAFAEKAMYHLPELVWAIKAGEPVWWCEGEKDADAIRGVGGVATSHWQGALHATREQARWFLRGEGPVLVVVDVDDAGAACGIHRQKLLLTVGVARSRIRIVKPPRPHTDAAEAVADGVRLSRFRTPSESRLTAAASRYTASRKQSRESSDWMGRAL